MEERDSMCVCVLFNSYGGRGFGGWGEVDLDPKMEIPEVWEVGGVGVEKEACRGRRKLKEVEEVKVGEWVKLL
jgi:hypothetical protein